MKTLYLLRHADPEEAAPVPMGDHERKLTARGDAQADAIGDFMQSKGIFPDFVISSSSVRTIQTVRNIFAILLRDEGMKVVSHFDRALYLASADTLRAHIAEAGDNVDNLLVVAHNPGLADLAYALSKGTLSDHTTDYSPGTLCVFKADIQHWRDLKPANAKLETVFTP